MAYSQYQLRLLPPVIRKPPRSLLAASLLPLRISGRCHQAALRNQWNNPLPTYQYRDVVLVSQSAMFAPHLFHVSYIEPCKRQFPPSCATGVYTPCRSLTSTRTAATPRVIGLGVRSAISVMSALIVIRCNHDCISNGTTRTMRLTMLTGGPSIVRRPTARHGNVTPLVSSLLPLVITHHHKYLGRWRARGRKHLVGEVPNRLLTPSANP